MKNIATKTEKMLQIEKEFGKPIEELLRKMWVEQELKRDTMCDLLEINHITLLRWLRKAGIYSRRLDF